MNLLNIVGRDLPPRPWAEGDNIPWDDPAFSERMLREHLTQDHDMASRRAEKIDAQVAFIARHLEGPSRVLDLACGPGLYTSRLARLGHRCMGIDFAPAAVRHAREQARREGLNCVYLQADLRGAAFGDGFDLGLLLYGQLNVFRREEALDILRRACAALRPGGLLVIEPHTHQAVRDIGEGSSHWEANESGLFSEAPHLLLIEAFWDDGSQCATQRFFVIDADSGEVTRYAMSMEAYADDEYRAMLTRAGFGEITFHPALIGSPDPEQPGLLAITARKD